MQPPDNATVTETPLTRFWKDDRGFICSVPKKATRTLENTKADYEYIKRILGNKKIFLVSDISESQPTDKEVRDFIAAEIPNRFYAIAFISNSALSRLIANIFFRLKPQKIPMKLFSDENKAVEWILLQVQLQKAKEHAEVSSH